MISKNNILKTIGRPDNKAHMLVRMHNTSDIIKQMQNAHYENSAYAYKICQSFRGATNKQTAKNIFNWIKENIEYRIEPAHLQSTKSIQRLISDGFGDCKHYSGFFAAILTALGIKNNYRFVSFNDDRTPTHVYVVAYEENGTPIYCDAVLNTFNTQKPFRHKIDKNMMVHLSGVSEMDYIGAKGRGRAKVRAAVKKVQAAKKQAVKKVTAKAKAVAKKAGAKVQKIARGVKRVSLSGPRAAFLGLVLVNFHSFATNLKKIIARDPNKVKNMWLKLGGNFTDLKNTIEKGAKNRAIFGVETIGSVSIAAGLAAATPIIVAMSTFIGASKDLIDQGKAAFKKSTGKSLEETPFEGGANMPSGSSTIVTPQGSTTTTPDGRQYTEGKSDVEPGGEKGEAESTQGPAGVNTKYLFIGGAALAALLLLKKK